MHKLRRMRCLITEVFFINIEYKKNAEGKERAAKRKLIQKSQTKWKKAEPD